jgi:hypothetical protein
MDHPVWESLWERYQRERRKVMEKETFVVLLQVFPAILVAQADGFTDTNEIQRLEEVVRFLCREQPELLSAVDWRSEMRYLAIDAEFWRRPFLEALRGYLEAHPEKYFQQAEFLYATAAASTGDILKNILMQSGRNVEVGHHELISDRERAEIERLSQDLGFDAHPEAASYLRRLIEQPHG